MSSKANDTILFCSSLGSKACFYSTSTAFAAATATAAGALAKLKAFAISVATDFAIVCISLHLLFSFHFFLLDLIDSFCNCQVACIFFAFEKIT